MCAPPPPRCRAAGCTRPRSDLAAVATLLLSAAAVLRLWLSLLPARSSHVLTAFVCASLSHVQESLFCVAAVFGSYLY